MALFGSDEDKERESRLQKENLELKRQIAEYEKVFVNFEDMKKVTDRVREENRRLLDKLEENVEVKTKMQSRIDELSASVNAKREEFQLNVNALESKNSDISIGENTEITGGVSTPKSITSGDSVVVQGGLCGNSAVELGKNNHIYGIVTSDNTISIGDNSTIEHNIAAGGTVTVGDNCIITKITSGANVIVGSSSRIKKIVACGTVSLKDGVKIEEGIEYRGSITMGNDVTITGEIKVKEG